MECRHKWNAPTRGLLSQFGYKVGANAVPERQRRLKLTRLYKSQLIDADGMSPYDLDRGYLREWGDPESPSRLLKLANTLAAEARNGKKRGLKMAESVKHWESDLDWLRVKYQDSSFCWPSTNI